MKITVALLGSNYSPAAIVHKLHVARKRAGRKPKKQPASLFLSEQYAGMLQETAGKKIRNQSLTLTEKSNDQFQPTNKHDGTRDDFVILDH